MLSKADDSPVNRPKALMDKLTNVFSSIDYAILLLVLCISLFFSTYFLSLIRSQLIVRAHKDSYLKRLSKGLDEDFHQL